MKKLFRTLPLLALLFVAVPHAYAGLSEGCYPAVQCDAGQDYYGTSCQKHINQTIGAIGDSCATSNPVGQTWNFNCTSGCYLSTNSTPNPCPGGIVIGGQCLALLNVVNDSVPVTAEKAYKIWDGATLTEIVHLASAGCTDGQTAVSDTASPTGWKCGSSSLWSTDGTNVWRATGRVGIGTAAPIAALDVRGASFNLQASMSNDFGAVLINDAVVIGDTTNSATGPFAVTLGGANNVAWGVNTVAMGENTPAISYDSVVMGRYAMQQYWNGSAWVSYDGANWVATDPIFIIGNGTSATPANAFTVLKNGRTSIGKSWPAAMLDVEASSTTIPLFSIGTSTTSATGYRSIAMGEGSTASALGAVAIAGGNASAKVGVAIGSGTKASGQWSMAVNYNSQAAGDYSFASGYFTDTTNSYATAMGINTLASGNASTALGDTTTASGFYSTSMGHSTTASGSSSVAMGSSTTASGSSSVAMGSSTQATEYGATAMGGGTIANGQYSTAIGYNAYATSFASTVVGRYNVVPITSGNSWVGTDPLFVVGNGTSTTSSNAMTILKNGYVGIHDYTPDYPLDVQDGDYGAGEILSRFQGTGTVDVYGDGWIVVSGNARKPGAGSWLDTSDIRLKDVESSYNNGLDAITQIDPIVFRYKKDNPYGYDSEIEWVGASAQDVQKVIPRAIVTDDKGYLQLSLDPVIWASVNAIKELKAENDALKSVVCEIKPEAEICK